MAKYKRVLLEIKRGPMSSTTIPVRPWEAPILREIHGEENVAQITGGEPIAHARLLGTMEEEEFNLEDIPLEYDRLVGYYGMHNEVKLSNCERVYGLLDDGKFEAAVRAGCSGGKVVDVRSKRGKGKATLDELRDKADELGLEWEPAMDAKELQDLINKVGEVA